MRNFENKMDKRKHLMVYEIYLYLVSCLSLTFFYIEKTKVGFQLRSWENAFVFNLVDLTLNKRLWTNTSDRK